jgi:hypothetical protein
MSTMTTSYRVLREGVSQKALVSSGDGPPNVEWIEFPVGSEIELSPDAATHLLSFGYVEPIELDVSGG